MEESAGSEWAGMAAQGLRALPAPAEDLHLIPSTSMVTENHHSNPWGSALSDIFRHQAPCRQNTHIHKR